MMTKEATGIGIDFSDATPSPVDIVVAEAHVRRLAAQGGFGLTNRREFVRDGRLVIDYDKAPLDG